jgi:hypothetical protein
MKNKCGYIPVYKDKSLVKWKRGLVKILDNTFSAQEEISPQLMQ